MEMIQTIDAHILIFIQDFWRFDWLNEPMMIYTELGDLGLIWIIMSLIMICFKKTRKVGILALLAMAVGALFTNVMIKPFIARPRPDLVVDGLLPLLTPPDPNSFPSGHTTAAFAMLYICDKAFPYKWVRPIIFVAALLMAYSRLYVGVHFTTDVLAGAIVGTFSGFLVWQGYKVFKSRRKKVVVSESQKEEAVVEGIKKEEIKNEE